MVVSRDDCKQDSDWSTEPGATFDLLKLAVFDYKVHFCVNAWAVLVVFHDQILDIPFDSNSTLGIRQALFAPF